MIGEEYVIKSYECEQDYDYERYYESSHVTVSLEEDSGDKKVKFDPFGAGRPIIVSYDELRRVIKKMEV